jgi:phosphohistidine phosphatase SixA
VTKASSTRNSFIAVVFGLMAAGASLVTGPAAAEMSSEELIGKMKDGGYVIYIRHASTEKDYADQIDATMGDCSTQRTLSESGWKEARAIGKAFEKHGIPVGDVISSEYCRAWQTADLAFGRYSQNSDLNFEPAEEYTDEQFAAMRERVTPHLSKAPDSGMNTVLVGHDDPFEAATGIYPEPMGVTYVVLPKGDGEFEVVGSIAPTAWP